MYLLVAIQCPNGTTYQQCGPLCPQSCDSISEACYGGCAEGCFCTDGKVMNEMQECVAPDLCPGEFTAFMVVGGLVPWLQNITIHKMFIYKFSTLLLQTNAY